MSGNAPIIIRVSGVRVPPPASEKPWIAGLSSSGTFDRYRTWSPLVPRMAWTPPEHLIVFGRGQGPAQAANPLPTRDGCGFEILSVVHTLRRFPRGRHDAVDANPFPVGHGAGAGGRGRCR